MIRHRSICFLFILFSFAFSSCLPTEDLYLPTEVNATSYIGANGEILPLPSIFPLVTDTPFPNPTDLTVSIEPAKTDVYSGLSIPIEGASCIPNKPATPALVQRVISGDSIEIKIGEKDLIVHYIGVSAPDPKTEEGIVAMNYNQSLISGKTVYLINDIDVVDGLGILQSYVLTDSFFINFKILEAGQAVTEKIEPNISCSNVFLDAEKTAQDLGEGIWSPVE